nr:MAG TPA: hypothetical protein [Caudoviricetes sp.]
MLVRLWKYHDCKKTKFNFWEYLVLWLYNLKRRS